MERQRGRSSPVRSSQIATGVSAPCGPSPREIPRGSSSLPRFGRGCASLVGPKPRLKAVGAVEMSSAPAPKLPNWWRCRRMSIFAYFNAQLGPLARATRTIPIVFVGASDPVGAGYVASLARPGGNITGFTLYDPSSAGKWLGILKEVTPGLTRVAPLINPDTAILRGTFYSKEFETAAASLGIEPVIAKVFSAADIEAAIASLAKQSGNGLIVAPDTFSEINGDLIVTLAAEHRVPTVYAISRFAKRGGLMSYGPNTTDAVKRSAAYVDRILRGEKPAELPVQAPVKFDLVVNAKAAKALGLTLPESFLLRADEVIE